MEIKSDHSHWCSILLHPHGDSYSSLALMLAWISVNVFKSFLQLTLYQIWLLGLPESTYNRYSAKGWGMGGCRPSQEESLLRLRSYDSLRIKSVGLWPFHRNVLENDQNNSPIISISISVSVSVSTSLSL